MLSNEEFVHTRTIDKASIKAGLNDDTIVASKKPNPAPESDDEFFDSLEEATPYTLYVSSSGATTARVCSPSFTFRVVGAVRK